MVGGRLRESEKEEDRRQWKRLLDWLAGHGMDVNSSGLRVQCRASGDAGNGLFALESCPKSSTLFTVPANALINVKTLSSLYPPTRGGLNLTANQVISLHLLLHRPVGSGDSLDPKFGPFISTMPRDFDSHPLTWTVRSQLDSEQSLLRALCGLLPPSVATSLRQASDRFWQDWKAICRYASAKPDVLSQASRSDRLVRTLNEHDNALVDEFLWAWLNVNTRCIYYRLDPSPSASSNFTLCPILDFANHAPSSTHIVPVISMSILPSTPGSKKRGATLGGDYTFLSSSETPVHKDDELFLQYGAHANRRLFTEYGFVNIWEEDECVSGAFSGEVDVQDMVEAILGERGTRGTWMQDVLEEEGYWGDWTLHSSPTPAHPSYRLITALRLCELFAECAQGRSSDEEGRLDQWRRVIAGENDIVSEGNEAAWRKLLLRLCTDIAQRARERMRLAEKPFASSEAEEPGWLQWQLKNIRLLWQEEMEVADAVAQSIRSNVDF